jgi:eukaryotic-like serine/threonine-protein kinase
MSHVAGQVGNHAPGLEICPDAQHGAGISSGHHGYNRKTMTAEPGAQLGPYELLSPIGAGGMGEVWKARDTRLDRIVAVKRLNGPHSTRFETEARAIAALNHPHICALYDVGPDYLVMEYVQGSPLRGPLEAKEAVRLALQVADALMEAHSKGILHRDLKPSNVLVTTRGSAKLLDFGLAKMTGRNDDTTKTMEGTLSGTAAYMSPEQARGEAVDERSDIFSFGVLLYEMVSGRSAFARGSFAETLSAILRDEPARINAPGVLARVITRCLSKSPAGRFASMAEVHEALTGPAQEQPQPSIAVLPFANLSAEKDNEYFSDGLAEEIINALTQLPGLRVIARTSAFRFRGEQDLKKIGEALNVSTVLEGSVRKSGNHLRITAQLVNIADDSQVWSERYDREMSDVFAIQDEISQAIVEKLKLGMRIQTARAHQPDVEAYHEYLKGRHWAQKLTPEALERAEQFFNSAIALDAAYALPYCGLAWCYMTASTSGAAPARRNFPRARIALQHALDRDPSLADARLLLGVIRGVMDYQWAAAGSEIRAALDSGLVTPEAYVLYARLFLWPNGRIEEAAAAFQKAQALDPLSPMVAYSLGELRWIEGREADARALFRQAAELDADFWLVHVMLAWCELAAGHAERMNPEIEALRRLQPGHTVSDYMQAIHLAVTERRPQAREQLEKHIRERDQRYFSGYYLGMIACCLEDLDQAFQLFNLAFEERDPLLLWLRARPFEAFGMKKDPRYLDLLRRMNLA